MKFRILITPKNMKCFNNKLIMKSVFAEYFQLPKREHQHYLIRLNS